MLGVVVRSILWNVARGVLSRWLGVIMELVEARGGYLRERLVDEMLQTFIESDSKEQEGSAINHHHSRLFGTS